MRFVGGYVIMTDQGGLLGKIGSNRELCPPSLNIAYGFYGTVIASHDSLHLSSLDMKL